MSATYPGDPGDPTVAAASDHLVYQVIRALRDLGVTSPATAGSVLTAAHGAGLTMWQRERVLEAFAAEGGWNSGACT